MDQIVDTEASDRSWSRQYETKITEALSAQFPNDRVRDAACATSLCRVRIEHSSVAAQSQFVSSFWTALPDGLAGFHFQREEDPSGVQTTLLHLVRRGYEGSVLVPGE